MSQTNVDFSDNPTGSELMDNYLAKEQENSLTSNSGIQRPSYAKVGTKWLDTSVEPWVLKMYTGSGDVVIGYIDKTKGTFKPDNALPELEGQKGKYLTTDGETSFWGVLDLNNKVNLNLGNSTAITNCITEIPQDIKLELNNGTLTLKAGSKVYIPNGAGKFDEKIVSSDVVIDNRTGTGELLLSVRKSSNAVDTTFIGNCLSGASLTPVKTSLHYDTANNIIRRYSSSVDTYFESSLPIALIKLTDGVYTSIDQVFNGFGYIGSTVFALPGVKGLAPNGRNEDGSLKNIIRVIDKVSVFSFTGSGTAVFAFAYNALGFSNYVYDVQTNRNTEYNNVRTNVIFGSGSFVNGKITSFTPKLPFKAVDYNDVKSLDPTITYWD